MRLKRCTRLEKVSSGMRSRLVVGPTAQIPLSSLEAISGNLKYWVIQLLRIQHWSQFYIGQSTWVSRWSRDFVTVVATSRGRSQPCLWGARVINCDVTVLHWKTSCFAPFSYFVPCWPNCASAAVLICSRPLNSAGHGAE